MLMRPIHKLPIYNNCIQLYIYFTACVTALL
jgi:hypothetical protein